MWGGCQCLLPYSFWCSHIFAWLRIGHTSVVNLSPTPLTFDPLTYRGAVGDEGAEAVAKACLNLRSIDVSGSATTVQVGGPAESVWTLIFTWVIVTKKWIYPTVLYVASSPRLVHVTIIKQPRAAVNFIKMPHFLLRIIMCAAFFTSFSETNAGSTCPCGISHAGGSWH